MTEHDVLVGFRLRLFTQTDELDNVSAACRAMGVDGSTYYRLESASIAGAWRRPTFVASLCSFSKSRSSFAISR